MPRFEIRPILIPDIKIRIYRLHGKKTAQPASPTPSHDHIQPRNLPGPQASVPETFQVPFPAIVDEQIHLHAPALALAKHLQALRELGGSFVSDNEQGSAASGDLKCEFD